MTAGLPFPLEAQPYNWDESRPPPPETLRLWIEVGQGIDKSQTGTVKRSFFAAGEQQSFLLRVI
jgi:hypothetical protein